MKQLFFFLFLLTYSVNAQDFSLIEAKVADYPKLTTAENLTKKIAHDFHTKEQQVKATFYWLTHNIRYDLDGYYHPKQKRIAFRYRNEQEKLEKLQAIKDEIVSETLQNREALCEGYAQTFAKICTLLNVENEVVKGYVRNSINDIANPKSTTNHAWNAVKINNQWVYIDATWAAGFVKNGKWLSAFNEYYYNIPKEKYFKTHYPESKFWQLRVGKMVKEDFYNQPIYTPSFLHSSLQLVFPNKGVLDSNKPIEIYIKNLSQNQTVFLGYSGYRYAIKPDKISTENNITKVTTTPPKNSKQLYLIVDEEVVLEFLIR